MAEGIRKDITKHEAARRQLETAVALFFFDDDAISIHVLASSAAVILVDVCKAKGASSFQDNLIDRVKAEYQDDFRRRLRRAYNYFKHADKDPFNELEHFDPSMNEYILFACCSDYSSAYGLLTPTLTAYQWWFLAAHPNLIKPEFPGAKILKGAFDDLNVKTLKEQRELGRDYLKAYLTQLGEPLPIRGW